MWEEKESYLYLAQFTRHKDLPTATRACTDGLYIHTMPVIADCNTGLHTAHPPCGHPIILLVSPYGRGLLPVSPDFRVTEAHGTQPHLLDATFLGHLGSSLLRHPTPNCLSKLSQAPNPSFPCPHSARGASWTSRGCSPSSGLEYDHTVNHKLLQAWTVPFFLPQD